MIKVLVVDDSPVAREFISHLLAADRDIEVIGTAGDGAEAIAFLGRKRPDVVTMDIHMPGMNGLDATQRIMETHPLPIVIVSGNWDPGEVAVTFQAMEAGALAIVQRPKGIGHADHEATAREMVRTVKLMSEVRVVRRRNRKRTEPPAAKKLATPAMPDGAMVVAIGASTGGPLVIQTILKGLPRDFSATVLIVQHMAAGFLRGMVDWLADTSAIPLKIAADGERLLPGQAYFAPEESNMGVTRDGRIELSKDNEKTGPKPSVANLFRSLADTFGRNAVGVLLSGMGRDGAAELKSMRDAGAVTIAQDSESSVVFGMPGAAVELGAADYVLPPDKIVATLVNLARKKD